MKTLQEREIIFQLLRQVLRKKLLKKNKDTCKDIQEEALEVLSTPLGVRQRSAKLHR